MKELTQEKLREILNYNPATGIFLWKKKGRGRPFGKVAGTKHSTGYIHITICRKIYKAHRLVWLYIHGKFPEYDMDHINHIKDDNSLKNLRSCTRSENMGNQRKQINNVSQYKGVSWVKEKRKWKSRIGHDNKVIHLGYFDGKEDAAIAYNKKSVELFGEFACLNEVVS